MEEIHKQEYRVRELATRTVTLFPTRAEVVREIKDVPLKPGANEILIVGLTPTVDEQSIKVEGTGSAIITDIAIELLPNREIFQEVYPDEEKDEEEDEEDEDEEAADSKNNKELQEVLDKLASLRDEDKRAKETVASAENRLKYLNSYGIELTRDREHQPIDVKIQDGIEIYRAEREKVFKDHMDGVVQERAVAKQIAELILEERRLDKLAEKEKSRVAKEKAKALREKEKQRSKDARKKRELAKEKQRIRKERESFWPKQVYTIKVSLDAASFTPMSSRRGSISSDVVKIVSEKEAAAGEFQGDDSVGTCDLLVSYLTTDASWSPTYDLALSTTSNTGHLCFDASVKNLTSETWSNAKVVLSTSHTDFGGLNDTIPTLLPWRVRLGGRYGGGNNQSDILYSRDEQGFKAGWWRAQQNQQALKPRKALFGLLDDDDFDAHPNAPNPFRAARGDGAAPPPPPMPQVAGGLFGSSSSTVYGQAKPAMMQSVPFGAVAPSALPPPPAAAPPPPPGSSLFGAAPQSSQQQSLFSTASVPQEMVMQAEGGPPRGGGLFGNITASRKKKESRLRSVAPEEDESAPAWDDDGPTMKEIQPELEFLESTFEETGFTTTYDLPGLKTLRPSLTASKQRVARVTFSSVSFNYTVVPKYKAAAYLKAKLRNGSKMTLLKGPAGLTLDGSFMGRTTLPRCSPGDSFPLSLGVDPAIRVVYPKPEVKRSQTGFISKEDNGVYKRSITIVNTRAVKTGNGAASTSSSSGGVKPVQAAQLTVLDQVPVSEDERLRVEILQPRGLILPPNSNSSGAASSPAVHAGAPGDKGSGSGTVEDKDKDWGKATAVLKKGGEITWDVSLNAGRAVKLALEYECTFPTSEQVINV